MCYFKYYLTGLCLKITVRFQKKYAPPYLLIMPPGSGYFHTLCVEMSMVLDSYEPPPNPYPLPITYMGYDWIQLQNEINPHHNFWRFLNKHWIWKSKPACPGFSTPAPTAKEE